MNREVYEKNIKAYKERYNKEYYQIDNNKYENKLEDTKDGNKTINIKIENKKIYLHSKYSPIKEAKRYYKEFKVRYGTLVICFGFSLSYYIDELSKKINRTDNIIVYEPDKELFDIVMKNIDISHIISNEDIKIILNLNDIKMGLLGRPVDKKIEIMPIYEKFYEEEIIEFMKQVKNSIDTDLISVNTKEKFKMEWGRNDFGNIESILNSYNMFDFKDVFKDKPIVVVGAGPSLNKNIHLLKEIEGKVCIICAFSAAKALEKQGIKPNFLVTVDSKQYGLEEYEANIPLLYIKEAGKELLKNHKSEKLFCLSIDEVFLINILNAEEKISFIPMSGTVASFAAGSARHFGASEIILIGQDFSWTKEKAHADGTVHKKTERYKIYHNHNMEEKDIYGNTVYTNKPFYRFKLWFDSFTASLPNNVKMIQATEGGLPIEGAETLTFREAIDKYCIDKYCDINDILNKFYKKNKLIGEEIGKEKVYENIRLVYDELKDTKKLIEEAVELSKKITKNIKYSTSGLKKNNNLIDRLNKIDQILKDNIKIKALMLTYSNDIYTYYTIDETDDEKLNFAIMNEKLYIEIDKILGNIIKIAKEEMEYED